MVIATENPIEQQGTYPLPEAQLDRFLFKHTLGYPERSRGARAWSQRKGASVRMPDPVRARRRRRSLDREQLGAVRRGGGAGDS